MKPHNIGLMKTEIPLIILLAEYQGTPDSLQKIGERHGLTKRGGMTGCRRLIRQLGIERKATPRWHSGPRMNHKKRAVNDWAWRGAELSREADQWKQLERAQYCRAVMATIYGCSPSMLEYKRNPAAGRERGRKAAKQRHQRYGHTATWKLKQAVRNAVARIARIVGHRRAPRTRTQDFLGCSYDQARAHIEARFADGMTWANHGTIWEVDHKRPLASFDLTDAAQRRAACHFTNLQPLLTPANRAKGASW
jgi:hypothetical protein